METSGEIIERANELAGQGEYERALDLLKKNINLIETGEIDPREAAEYLWAMHRIAPYQSQGASPEEMQALLKRIINLLETEPASLKDLLYAYDQLASGEDSPEAIEIYQKAIALAESQGATSDNRAYLYQKMAYVYQRTDDREGEEKCLLSSIEISEQAGERSVVYGDLARLLEEKDPERAEALLKRDLQLTMDEGSPDVVIRLNTLAEFLLRQERFSEALNFFKECIPLEEKINGPDLLFAHIIADYRRNMARCFRGLGDRNAAAKETREATRLMKIDYSDNYIYAETALEFADDLLEIEEFNEALEVYQELQAWHLENSGRDIMQALFLNRQGICLEQAQKFPEAKERYTSAREVLIEIGGEEHPDLAWVDERIAACVEAIG